MADNKKKQPAKGLRVEEATRPAKKPRRFLDKIKRLFKIILIALLLLCLIVGGFFLGVYLRVFDMNTVNEKLELYKYPVIGEYFVEPDETTEKIAVETPSPATPTPAQTKNAAIDPKVAASKPVVLNKEEIDKQIKQRQAEENKRISKLARLYEPMKPAEAAAILDGLNDDMTVAILDKMDETQASKIMAAFDADKSARLSRVIYNGRPPLLVKPQPGAQPEQMTN